MARVSSNSYLKLKQIYKPLEYERRLYWGKKILGKKCEGAIEGNESY